eukprot:jgi/Botrbrau1/8242/Bobra.0392s0037.1
MDYRTSISDLPESVLAVILGHLLTNPDFLRAARLVCRSFRAASIPLITTIVVDLGPPRGPSDTQILSQSRLTELQAQLQARHLQQLHCLSHLTLRVQHLGHFSLLDAPGVLPILRDLTLCDRAYPLRVDWGPAELRVLVSQFAAATALTRLNLLWDSSLDETTAVLLACPQLEALELGQGCLSALSGTVRCDKPAFARALAGLTRLRSLSLGYVASSYLSLSLPQLGEVLRSMPRLQELVGLEPCEDADVVTLGSLVGLTSLEVSWMTEAEVLCTEPLRRLTALRTLSIHLVEEETLTFHMLQSGLGALPHLQDLSLHGEKLLPRNLLDGLRGLTALRLHITSGVDPRELLRAPLANLAVLHVHIKPLYRRCPADSCQVIAMVAASLKQVQSLHAELSLEAYFAFFPFLGGMTRLTELHLWGGEDGWSKCPTKPRKRRRISSPVSPYWVFRNASDYASAYGSEEEDCSEHGSSVYGSMSEDEGQDEFAVRTRDPLPPAAYLSRLTGLQSLVLHRLLDVCNAPEDVRLLAGLTQLTSLSIVGVGDANAFAALEERGGLAPLSSLRMLSKLDATGSWCMRKMDSVLIAIDEAQMAMGIPKGRRLCKRLRAVHHHVGNR